MCLRCVLRRYYECVTEVPYGCVLRMFARDVLYYECLQEMCATDVCYGCVLRMCVTNVYNVRVLWRYVTYVCLQSYAVPARTSHIQSYKPQSTNILNEYKLSMYERVVQVSVSPA